MTGPAPPPQDELSAYGALIRRRWRLVAAGVVAGLLLPGAYVLFGPKAYTATTSVLVKGTGAEKPAAIANGESSTEINLDTEAEIATSIVVARRARQIIGTEISPQDLVEYHVEVEVPPNSAVLAISYEAPTPEGAQAGAQAFANAYLNHRSEQAKATLKQQQKALQAKMTSLNKRLEQVTNKLATKSPNSPQYSVAQAKRDRLNEQISALGTQLGVLATTTITPGEIISAAGRPTSPSSPIAPLYLAGGLLLGSLGGFAGAMLRDRADTRVRHVSDIERLIGLPVLMEVPGKRDQSQPSLLPPRSRAGQGFHGLSHSLGAALGHGNHVVLVTGASPGSGTSTVATNLAATLARTGSPTILVCADLQAVTSTWMLGLQPSPGLSDILLHGTRVSAVEQRPVEPSRLRVIAPGMDTEIASEQLQTQAMERLVGELRQSATYIVVEAPPTSESADAQALADLSDVALVVVEMPRAEREQVREGVQRLDRVGAAVLGAVAVPTLEEPPALRQSQRMLMEQRGPAPGPRPETAPMPAVGPRTSAPPRPAPGPHPAAPPGPGGTVANGTRSMPAVPSKPGPPPPRDGGPPQSPPQGQPGRPDSPEPQESWWGPHVSGPPSESPGPGEHDARGDHGSPHKQSKPSGRETPDRRGESDPHGQRDRPEERDGSIESREHKNRQRTEDGHDGGQPESNKKPSPSSQSRDSGTASTRGGVYPRGSTRSPGNTAGTTRTPNSTRTPGT